MRRRDFLSLVAGAAFAAPRVAAAQPSSKVYRLGTLTPGPPLDGLVTAISIQQAKCRTYRDARDRRRNDEPGFVTAGAKPSKTRTCYSIDPRARNSLISASE